MPSGNNPERAPSAVLAVVVLYGMSVQKSPAAQALLTTNYPIDVLLWDNSPHPASVPALPDRCFYRSAPTNPGLATAYNAGLLLAEERKLPWLLLLDQDTDVHDGFLRELMEVLPTAPEQVAGFVPRLQHRNAVVSPFTPGLAGPNTPLRPDRPLQAFNSGAALRVQSLQAMGGFDPRFPLDYLDHATFAALQRNGGKIQGLRASLNHPLSTDTGSALSPQQRIRQQSVLAAERRYYKAYGTASERLLHPIRLLRRAASVLVYKRDWASARQILRALADHA